MTSTEQEVTRLAQELIDTSSLVLSRTLQSALSDAARRVIKEREDRSAVSTTAETYAVRLSRVWD